MSALTSGNWTVNTNPIATGTGSLTKDGAGTLTLATANTFSGNTRSKAGTLNLSDGSALAKQHARHERRGLRHRELHQLNYRRHVRRTHRYADLSLENNASAAVALSVGNNGTSPAAYSGVLSGSGSLTKVGTGILTLTGTNAYLGTTTVSDGMLLVNGNNTGTGAVTVR